MIQLEDDQIWKIASQVAEELRMQNYVDQTQISQLLEIRRCPANPTRVHGRFREKTNDENNFSAGLIESPASQDFRNEPCIIERYATYNNFSNFTRGLSASH